MKRSWLTVLVIFFAAPLIAQDPPPAALDEELSRGAAETRTIAPGSSHGWRLSLAANQYAVVEVGQVGLDLMAQLIDPSGQIRAEVDRTDVPDLELISWIAAEAGEWTIRITPFAEAGDPAAYTVGWSVAREATTTDRQMVAADSLGNLALSLEDDGRPDLAEPLHRSAIEILEQVHGANSANLLTPLSDLARVVEQQRRLADAEPILVRVLELTNQLGDSLSIDVGYQLIQLGVLNLNIARYPESQKYLEQALVAFTASTGEGSREVAGTLGELGRVHHRQANHDVADDYYNRSIEIFGEPRFAGDPGLGVTLNNLAVSYMGQARFKEASELYLRVGDLNATNYGPDHMQVAINQFNLGALYIRWARYREAEPLLRRSLAIHIQTLGPNHPATGKLFLALASLSEMEGNFAESEQLYRRGLDLFEATLDPGHPDIGGALTGLAHVAQSQDRFEVAIGYYERVLDIYVSTLGERHPFVSEILSDLGGLYLNWGDHQLADSLLTLSNRIDEELYGSDHPSYAGSLVGRARSLIEQRRFAESIPLSTNALPIFETVLGADHPAVGMVLIGLAQGVVMVDSTQADSALSLLDRAIDIYRGTPNDIGAVSAYVVRATVRKRFGELAGAIDDLEEALVLVDEQRAKIGGGEDTRAKFFRRYSDLFTEMVSWQLEAGDTTAAFAAAERGRARVLLDQLAAGKIDLRRSIPTEIRVVLEQRESETQSRLTELRQRITMLRGREDLPFVELDQRITVLSDSLFGAENDYRQVYADIKNASPLWRDEITSGGRPSSLREVQSVAVPVGGMMLSYQVGTTGSVLFVVPPRGGRVQAYDLEITPEIADVFATEAGPLTGEELMYILGGTQLNSPSGARGGLFSALSDAERGGGSKVVGRAQPGDPSEVLHALWKVLVPDTVWQQLQTATEVVVIPDGPLHFLPFAALVVDSVATTDTVTYWLDDGPPVRYAASATALTNITRRPAGRIVRTADAPMMLSVSDPVFDPADVAAMTERSAEENADPVTRGQFERGGGSLVRLPGTAAETERIREGFGASADDRLQVLSGLEATESNLMAALDGKRFLHLATHGLVDYQGGGLFASLALTPPDSATSDHADDGFWQLHEVYAQRLGDLELAVLSACESNIGMIIAGEGVFALSRGFVAAGAQRVVASQWEVDDASTAELIGEFFRMVIEQETAGQQVGYAAALRDAQLAIRRQSQWQDPFFWAPFVLSGRQ